MAAAQVFKALGDPVRLEIVQRLSDGQPHNLQQLSQDLGISRQGARKQIQVLVTANVITIQPVGREMLVSLERDSLQLAKDFISGLEQQWDQRLSALKQLLEHE